MSQEAQLATYKWISILEGVSFLLLLFIAMPLKYIWNNPFLVEHIGMIHGILFVAYILGGLFLFKKMKWSLTDLAIILCCSFLPFGPFYVERKYL